MLFLLFLLSLSALASSWPDLSSPASASAGDGRKDAALVIGIEDYSKLDDVLGARENAEDWYRWLVKSRRVPLHRVHRLTDGEAVDHKIRSELSLASSEVEPGGTLWVVFIGHGTPSKDGQDGLLVGADADRSADGIYQRSVSRSEVLRAMESGRQEQAVLVLDACFSGQGQAGQVLVPGLQALVPTSARVKSSRVTVLTGAGSGEFAGRLPGTARPAFSYLVLGALRGWGDGDGDGRVTAGEAATYALGALTATVRDRKQTPSLDGPDLVLSSGRERGPDLVELAMGSGARPRAPSSTVGSTGGEGLSSGDIDALLLAQERRKAAEAEEAALLARVRVERESTLSAAVSGKQAEASALWKRMAPLVASGGPEAKQAVESFVKTWADAQVVVDDVEGRHARAVGAREVGLARQWLGEAALVVAPVASTGKAGERVLSKTGIPLRVIPAGRFTMGCTAGAGSCEDDEKPAHEVVLTRSFLLMETEVTQAQWQAVMGSNPSEFKGATLPVEMVYWLDAVTFANALSKKEGLESCYVVQGESVSWPKGLACTGYRLPTEAEWEYAARAGGDSLYAGGSELSAVGWTYVNAGGKTQPVGGKKANAWGLHDMSGNVWEWTWDLYGAYTTGLATDPMGASSGQYRVGRGGGWSSSSTVARLADRVRCAPGNPYYYSLGLRLARSIP